MNRFASLLETLILTPSRNAKISAMAQYFQDTPDPDRGYALAAITRDLTLANLKPAGLRALVAERVPPAARARRCDAQPPRAAARGEHGARRRIYRGGVSLYGAQYTPRARHATDPYLAQRTGDWNLESDSSRCPTPRQRPGPCARAVASVGDTARGSVVPWLLGAPDGDGHGWLHAGVVFSKDGDAANRLCIINLAAGFTRNG